MEATNVRPDTWLANWVRIVDARGVTVRAERIYAAQHRVFHDPSSPDRTPTFANIEAASRYAYQVSMFEMLPSAYVIQCPELVGRATTVEILGRTAICVPMVPSILWTRATVLHELAHVEVGFEHGHDQHWTKSMVRMVGTHISDTAAGRLRAEFARVPPDGDGPCLPVREVAELIAAS